jgi:hypothetical protein
MNNKFLTNFKVLTAGVVLALGVTSSATALTVKFATQSELSGIGETGPAIAQVASDNSGLTSAFVPANNIIDAAAAVNGYFVETFDYYDDTAGAVLPSANITEFNVPLESDGCAINSLGVTVSSPGQTGVANVRKGSEPGAAEAPKDDTSCYAYATPGDDISLPSFIDIDYRGFLDNFGTDVYISYLGFYMGSIDNYNSFEFYQGGVEIDSISGTNMLNMLNATSGSTTEERSNPWVQFTDFGLNFDKLRVITTRAAGEFDNVTIGLSTRPVPAPTGLALLGLGLLGMGIRKRYSK